MSKIRKVFSCQSCGFQSAKWLGRCTDCGAWNSFTEETYAPQGASDSKSGTTKGIASVKDLLRNAVGAKTGQGADLPLPLDEIIYDDTQRAATRFKELDRVLGGGIVPGCMVLIGGDPGIGKSTILMQALDIQGQKVLYVSGEESAQQIKLRAQRLGVVSKEFFVYAENSFERIFAQVQKHKPDILIIDSIQTVYTESSSSAPGSVSQIRECTAKLMGIAKTLGTATFIIGHITKEGSIAGPKVLEHMVDTVLYFENSAASIYRLLRTVKNRFGSTNEIGVFEMAEGGLREVSNPSELFLQERPINAPGTVVTASVEGSRTILVEIQALVSSSNFGTPRRTTIGVDHNKVALLLAVIEKRMGLPLYGHDVFVNVAGGIELDEPAVDLAVALALMSSFQGKLIPPKWVFCGEIGLTGELRQISNLENRMMEAKKLGFHGILAPHSTVERLPQKLRVALRDEGFDVKGVSTLVQAADFLQSI